MTARYGLAALSVLVLVVALAGFAWAFVAGLVGGAGFMLGVSWQYRRDLRSLGNSPWKPAP
jgi:O-antigen/teichoic acid export membrane protein